MSGEYTSLALDARGNPVISYFDFDNFDLKLVHCGNAELLQSGNSIQTVDSAGSVGFYTSLVLDASGNLAISYYDGSNSDLKLAFAPADTTGTVTYDFGGFLDPIDPNSVNVVKAGRTVPISFSLNGDQGLSILDGSPTAVRVACDSGENLTEVDNTEPAGNSGLRYDASTDTYTYVWKTKKSWKRQCRELQLSLDDGMIYTAQFQFK